MRAQCTAKISKTKRGRLREYTGPAHPYPRSAVGLGNGGGPLRRLELHDSALVNHLPGAQNWNRRQAKQGWTAIDSEQTTRDMPPHCFGGLGCRHLTTAHTQTGRRTSLTRCEHVREKRLQRANATRGNNGVPTSRGETIVMPTTTAASQRHRTALD